MDERKPLRERRRRALRGLALLLLLTLSPLGAPVLGFLIAWGCDIPWEGAYHCVVPDWLIYYFGSFFFAALTSGGIVVAIEWLGLSAALVLGCLFCLGRVTWLYGVERLSDGTVGRPDEDGAVL